MTTIETSEDLILQALGDEAELAFDAVARAAAATLGCPIACVTLLGREHQWFKAHFGFAHRRTPLDQSFCRHAVAANRMLVVPDATDDSRFADNPLVTGPDHLRFYAGEPLRVALRPCAPPLSVGALCVIDTAPRELDAPGREALAALAAVASDLIEARLAAKRAADTAHGLSDCRDCATCQFHQAERMAGIGSWRLTLADQRLEWSQQARLIHEVAFDNAGGIEQVLQLFPPHDRPRLETAITDAIDIGEPYDLELDLVTASGRMRRVRAIGEIERLGSRPVALIGVIQDITERWEHEVQLKTIADTDELTRLATRRYFNEFCDHLLGPHGPGNLPLALALIDLDHFKAINDRHGHAAGDAVLEAMADALRERWLVECLAARLGGDEFVLVICEPALIDDLVGTVTRLLDALVLPVPGAEPQQVSATIGVCASVTGRIDRSELLARADAALYAAKAVGRGTAMIDRDGEQVPVRGTRRTGLRAA